ncbi:serine/threonine protein kinase [Candidatus Magnetomonas plexicatena]|uniref:serine/threonine protein kinase n=1 Tax=Candidatus Magnetomonas plexicatena TaxID=2552947 RepID=UPI00110082F8|nr:protein kinase [Nitrospirales bacterium LBB_01]
MKQKLQQKFDIRKLIGEGLYSKVYEASELASGKPCALKVFLNDTALVQNEECELRFLREIEVMKDVSNDYTVGILDDGTDTSLWYSMELMEGSVRDLLLSDALDKDIVKYAVALQCLICVELIHKQDVIHRDIKPENFLFKYDSNRELPYIYVSDFGHCRPISTKSTLTRTGIGSELYASPESMYHARNVTVRSDIYSLAKVIYEIFTGVPLGAPYDSGFDKKSSNRLFPLCTEAANSNPSLRHESVFDFALDFLFFLFNDIRNQRDIQKIIDVALRVTDKKSLEDILASNTEQELNLIDIIVTCAFPFIKDETLLKIYSGHIGKIFLKMDETTKKGFLKIYAQSIVNGNFKYVQIDRESFIKKSRRLKSFAFIALEKFLFM